MATGKEQQQWWHTASLMAIVINMLSAKGNKIDPAQLHPMLKHEKKKVAMQIGKENFSDLKGILGL